MPPSLPSSLSPLIAVSSSSDLNDLLDSTSLPTFSRLLQSFSPLPQITTRTTTLQSVSHASFHLRFCELPEIESACKEDAAQRAERSLDWIGLRIGRLSPELEEGDGRTPWWDELKRCVEGDIAPSTTEGWNHPVAILYVASTTAPNPLASVTGLHSRAHEIPAWVDNTYIRFTLIVHPENSSLSDEEVNALMNAVKKQFGPSSYLLPLHLSTSPLPPPVRVPRTLPRLPPAQNTSPTEAQAKRTDELRLSQDDIQSTAKLIREFATQTLLPWMERTVLERNEAYANTRRLGSRLFSSTRRLFGTSTPSTPSGTPPLRSSTLPPDSSLANGSAVGLPVHRRLAEFATILGDYKLAVSVWDTLRKEGGGGADILPLLLAPGHALTTHANSAISSTLGGRTVEEPRPDVQLQLLRYAVRWEVGIGSSALAGREVKGERWLVGAAVSAEPHSALLLAHAAFLSERLGARRRAAFWYAVAARVLEKHGIRPLTIRFLSHARRLYSDNPKPVHADGFDDAFGSSKDGLGFEEVLPGIEHSLGRLRYTTGDVEKALHHFLTLLHQSTSRRAREDGEGEEDVEGLQLDTPYLEDFKMAFEHLNNTRSDHTTSVQLDFALSFLQASETRVRLHELLSEGSGDLLRDATQLGDNEARVAWEKIESSWKRFRPDTTLRSAGKAALAEPFWVDLRFRNPLDAGVTLAGVTAILSDDCQISPSEVDIEVVGSVVLPPRGSQQVPIRIVPRSAGTVKLSHVGYSFLGLVSAREPLSVPGRLLHDTQQQRQSRARAPDVLPSMVVEARACALVASLKNDLQAERDEELVVLMGERLSFTLEVSNVGVVDVDEVVILPDEDASLYFQSDNSDGQDSDAEEVWTVRNGLEMPAPFTARLDQGVLSAQGSLSIPFEYHCEHSGDRCLRLLVVYRAKEDRQYHAAHVSQTLRVQPLLQAAAVCSPSLSDDDASYQVHLEIENLTTESVEVRAISSFGASWVCNAIAGLSSLAIPSRQQSRVAFRANPWREGRGSQKTLEFARRQLGSLAKGVEVARVEPPKLDVLRKTHGRKEASAFSSAMKSFIMSETRHNILRTTTASMPSLPPAILNSVFPLLHPHAVDFVLSWRTTRSGRSRNGHILVSGLYLGASYGLLGDTLAEIESGAVKQNRSMYAEGHREKLAMVEAVRRSVWNADVAPVVVKMRPERMLVRHDFGDGPCRVPVAFVLTNFSLSHSTRCVLRLAQETPSEETEPHLLSPTFVGRQVHRTTINPGSHSSISTFMSAHSYGSYHLGSWTLEVDLLPAEDFTDHPPLVRHYNTGRDLVDQTIVVITAITASGSAFSFQS